MKRALSISIIIVFCSCVLFAADKKQVKGPSIKIMESEIDLGVIEEDVEEIVGSIYVYNDGSELLSIYDVDGPCSCFAGYTGPESIKPQEGGEIQVKFTKSKIPAGKAKRKVKIKTNDPVNEIVEVTLSFEVERGQVEEEIRKLNKELKAVRSDLRKILLEVKRIKDPNAKLEDSHNHNHNKKKRPPDTSIYDIPIGTSPTIGPAEAIVTIVEFSSFQCGWCVREYPKLKQIMNEYPGKVKLVFKHCPLKNQKRARPAHAAAELAKREKGVEGFWKIHDMIFENSGDLEISTLRGYAKSLGMDLVKFDKVMSDPEKIEALIEPDILEARETKVHGTPTVLINGLKLSGKRSIGDYKARIDQIIRSRR